MTEKSCPRCKKLRPLDDFSKHSGYCTACRREYRKDHYEKNKLKYKGKAKAWTKENAERNREYVINILQNTPCRHCGESNPVVLEFHHTDSKQKNFNISAGVFHYTLKTLTEEIEKCDILCANCHRIVTAEEGGWIQNYARGVF